MDHGSPVSRSSAMEVVTSLLAACRAGFVYDIIAFIL